MIQHHIILQQRQRRHDAVTQQWNDFYGKDVMEKFRRDCKAIDAEAELRLQRAALANRP